MKYEEYLKLGFTRQELDDVVELKNSGYGGFVLTKELNKTICIEVCYPELDKPKLYVEKSKEPSFYHITPISPEMATDLIKSFKTTKK